MKKRYIILMFLFILAILTIFFGEDAYEFIELRGKQTYGVFLSIEDKNIEALSKYKHLVVDAQYFTKEEIRSLQRNGTLVYSYLNIGSLESFRGYYKDFHELALGKYEYWDEENWIDVSKSVWQDFIVNNLAQNFIEKGVDGFFVDNCDVYSIYPSIKIFKGLSNILHRLKKYDKKVIINGADEFVEQYHKEYGSVKGILTGINQESVFSNIDFEGKKLIEQNKIARKHYQLYLEKYKKKGIDIYMIEYTTDKELIKHIKLYSKRHNFRLYISNSIELD